MKLFVLTDVNQIDKANAIKFDDERFLTADMAVAYELERLGIDFTDEWDYLSAEEILKIGTTLILSQAHGTVI